MLLRQISVFLLVILGFPFVAHGDAGTVPVTDPNVAYSPYNWYKSGSAYAQSPNPGAYLKLGFTGTKIAVNFDVSPLTGARVPAPQYPLVRYSVDGGPPKSVQLTPTTASLPCASGLAPGRHTLLLQYVAGYVFLDFWTPINVVRVTGFTLDDGASTVAPWGAIATLPKNALFLGDSITNGDNTVTTFAGGVTNAVETQDATVGYVPVVAAGIGSEYGIVAYGGAAWDRNAADGHTPGLMTFASMLDSVHSRLVGGKLSPVPQDIFVNMGENAGPNGNEVPALLTALRAASSAETNIFVIVPFSGRARAPLTAGVQSYQIAAPTDAHVYLLDLGNNPYLTDRGPTMLAVDGQHPLAALDALLGAQLVQARAVKLSAANRLH
jgi:hypothetical protein